MVSLPPYPDIYRKHIMPTTLSSPSNGLRQQASQYLQEGSYGIKVIYKDGSEEFQGFQETLAPREKRTINIQSNGQLDEIKQIDLQYRESESEAYKTLSINPL